MAVGVTDRRLCRILDHANALVFIVDGARRFELCNRALAELIGCPVADLVGTELSQWIPAADRPELERALQKLQAGEMVTGHEVSFQTASGSVVRGLFNLSALLAGDGAVEAVIGIGQDSSEIRTLEHQVIQAEKLATLGQLAAGVVHEINNPLTSISVYADYLGKKLRKQGAEAGELAMLDKILDGANRILKCVRDLVNYAKPSPARLDVLSLNEVVERSVSFCEHVIERASATLEKQLAYELPLLYGVEDQLQQVLINVITNACHAIPEQGGQIWIRTSDLRDGNLLVEVGDNGHGITAEHLPHIFDPFFTTKEPGAGTGLGLSIVKKIVDFHEGSIMVRSSVGGGAVFSIALPTKPLRTRGG